MNREQLPSYYPVFLKIDGKKCVVVGGGQVALRKVMVLIEHRASVDVISPELCPELIELSEDGQVRVFRRHYQLGDLQSAFLVIAATDDSDINLRVATGARSKAVLVNVVDDAEHSSLVCASGGRHYSCLYSWQEPGFSPENPNQPGERLW